MRLLAQQAPQALLQLRQHDALLGLILSFAIGVTGLADLIRLEEDNLAQPFVGVDLCRKRRRIGNLERHEAFPLGLEWRKFTMIPHRA